MQSDEENVLVDCAVLLLDTANLRRYGRRCVVFLRRDRLYAQTSGVKIFVFLWLINRKSLLSTVRSCTLLQAALIRILMTVALLK